jgi:selenoprotein W-related protein
MRMSFKVSIEYCSICQYTQQVSVLIAEILSLFERKLDSLVILPSKKIGDFEIKLNDQIIFSKQQSGRLPNPGEVEQLLSTRLFGGK